MSGRTGLYTRPIYGESMTDRHQNDEGPATAAVAPDIFEAGTSDE